MSDSSVEQVDPERIRPNVNNPRRYFKESTLDELRASIQEIGVLVPLIVHVDPDRNDGFVLLDGERRWTCALDLGLMRVPVNIIPPPGELDSILRMFNIHAVREEWPLISIALSLEQVMAKSGIDRDRELAQLTGLKPSTVRRAKRLLQMPPAELEMIKEEAHLPRQKQVHREDLYLEISDAVSAIERTFPDVAETFGRDSMIRQLAAKREERTVRSVTDYRNVAKLANGVEDGFVDRGTAAEATREMLETVEISPSEVFDDLAKRAYERKALAERTSSIADTLSGLIDAQDAGPEVVIGLRLLREQIDRLLGPD